ncbi:hypothetical protein YC2023_023783 [Brassica napus]
MTERLGNPVSYLLVLLTRVLENPVFPQANNHEIQELGLEKDLSVNLVLLKLKFKLHLLLPPKQDLLKKKREKLSCMKKTYLVLFSSRSVTAQTQVINGHKELTQEEKGKAKLYEEDIPCAVLQSKCDSSDSSHQRDFAGNDALNGSYWASVLLPLKSSSLTGDREQWIVILATEVKIR